MIDYSYNTRGHRRPVKHGSLLKSYRLSDFNEEDLHRINMNKLKDLIDYFVRLKNQGILKDDEFSALISKVCSNFVKNEIALIVTQTMSDSLKEAFEFGDD